MVSLDKLPESLLNGRHLHCRPVEGGAVMEASIMKVEGLAVTDRLIFCPARLPKSRCSLMGRRCLYWRTTYIIGSEADKKTGGGYKD